MTHALHVVAKTFSLFEILADRIFSSYHSRLFHGCIGSLRLKASSSIIGHQYIVLGASFSAFSRLRLEAIDRFGSYTYTPSVSIGSGVSINNDCHIACVNRVEIGDNVLIGSRVLITDHFHGNSEEGLQSIPIKRPLFSKGKVSIGSNVLIGDGACILPGVIIGHSSVIGANSVVTKSFPPYSVIGGSPAKVLK